MSEENTTRQPVWGREEEENTLQLADIWGMIWNNRMWYIISVAICLFLAIFYLYRTPKTYSRSAKVIVDEGAENASLRELASFGSTNVRSRYGGTNVMNEIQAFTSPDLMQKVVERLGYETSYIDNQRFRTRELFTNTPFTLALGGDNPPSSFSFTAARHKDSTFVLSDFVVAGNDVKAPKVTGAFGDTLSTPVGKVVLTPTSKLNNWGRDVTVNWRNSMAMAKSFDSRLSVSLSDKQSSVLVLSLQDLFPARAANVISTLIDIYNEEWVENKNRAARNTSEFINERLTVIEQELGGVESDLKNYKEQHGITDIGSISQNYLNQSSAYASKFFEVNNQLSIARYVKSYLNDPAHANSLIPAGTGIDSSVESQISSYNSQMLNRDRLLSASSAENPVVADMNDALDALKSAINRSIDNLIATLQLQANKIQSEENAIMGRISNVSGQELQLLVAEQHGGVQGGALVVVCRFAVVDGLDEGGLCPLLLSPPVPQSEEYSGQGRYGQECILPERAPLTVRSRSGVLQLGCLALSYLVGQPFGPFAVQGVVQLHCLAHVGHRFAWRTVAREVGQQAACRLQDVAVVGRAADGLTLLEHSYGLGFLSLSCI